VVSHLVHSETFPYLHWPHKWCLTTIVRRSV